MARKLINTRRTIGLHRGSIEMFLLVSIGESGKKFLLESFKQRGTYNAINT